MEKHMIKTDMIKRHIIEYASLCHVMRYLYNLRQLVTLSVVFFIKIEYMYLGHSRCYLFEM